MSLVYLVTSLPRLKRGAPPPLSKEELIRSARQHVEGPDRDELERVLLLEEIEETARLMSAAYTENPDISSGELTTLLRASRNPTPDGPPPSELPDWVMMPLPQHVLYRRFFHLLYEKATSPFVHSVAAFEVDLYEVLTALLAEKEDMSKKDFLHQMEGAFDSAARVIVDNWEGPTLGVEDRFPWFKRVEIALELRDFVQIEMELNRLRWEQLDKLRGVDQFSIDAVLCTYFQLRILEREASWHRERGEALLEQALALPEGLAL
jgi:hypothetical protein